MSHQSVGEINSKVFEFEWKIKFDPDFTSETDGQKMSSRTFSAYSSGQETKWRLDLYPSGHDEDDEKFVSIFLKSLNSFEVEAYSTFFLLDKNNINVGQTAKCKQLFNIENLSWGYTKFVAKSFIKDPVNNLIVDNNITFGCQITICNILNRDRKKFLRSTVLDDFEKLLLAGKFSDLTVVTADNKKMRVHKNILSSRCRVFQLMLDDTTIEKIGNVVNIEDINYAVLLEVFRFIYCGKVNDIRQIHFELLYAAEKYAIDGLKSICEESMVINLTRKNAIKYLLEAVKYGCSNEMKIINFIAKNANDIVTTPEYLSLEISHPHLTNKIEKQVCKLPKM